MIQHHVQGCNLFTITIKYGFIDICQYNPIWCQWFLHPRHNALWPYEVHCFLNSFHLLSVALGWLRSEVKNKPCHNFHVEHMITMQYSQKNLDHFYCTNQYQSHSPVMNIHTCFIFPISAALMNGVGIGLILHDILQMKSNIAASINLHMADRMIYAFREVCRDEGEENTPLFCEIIDE